jgi:hypothetical protein
MCRPIPNNSALRVDRSAGYFQLWFGFRKVAAKIEKQAQALMCRNAVWIDFNCAWLSFATHYDTAWATEQGSRRFHRYTPQFDIRTRKMC